MNTSGGAKGGHFFSVASWLFRITWCSFSTSLSSRGKLVTRLPCRMRLKSRSEFVLIIFYLQLIKGSHAGSAIADKKHGKLSSSWQTRCEWTSRNTKKSWRHTEKMSLRGAFQCTTRLVWNKLAAPKIKRFSNSKDAKNFRVCRDLLAREVLPLKHTLQKQATKVTFI